MYGGIFRVSGDAHQPCLSQISQFDFHFPLYYAAVDTGCRVAERVQQQRRHRHVRRTYGCAFQHSNALLGFASGCSLALLFWGLHYAPFAFILNRRDLPEYGRESGRSSRNIEYTTLQNLCPRYTANGQAGNSQHDLAGVQQARWVPIPYRITLKLTHTVHQVCSDGRKARGTSEHPGRCNDCAGCCDYVRINQRTTSGRKSYTTVTGKSGQTQQGQSW